MSRNRTRQAARQQSRALVVAKASSLQTSPKNVPAASAAIAFNSGGGQNWGLRGRVGKANVQLFRNWAEHSEWVRAAINVRKSQISAAEWDIVPYDKKNSLYSPDLAAKIKTVFDRPNPQLDSFRSFLEPIVEDILVLDAGVIENVRNMRGQIAQLWGVDGGTIRVNALWDGSDLAEPRYFWYPDFQERARFRNEDMVYMMANPATYRVVGLSPLETLKLTIDAELSGQSYNHRQVINAAPDGMLDLGEGARPEQVTAFQNYWQAEVAGKGAMAFLGGTKNAKFVPFRSSNRDMQFLEWQTYLVRKIAAVFGLSPQDLGVTHDINRATSEVIQENTEDRGFRPLLALIQEYLTREIVWDPMFGGPANNLSFRFTRLNLKESLARAQMYKLGLAGVSYVTVNEVRIDSGREPLEGDQYDQLMVITPTGAVSLTDVPSAREAIEGTPTAATQQPSATAKHLELISSSLASVVESLRSPVAPPEVHIDKGAIEVNVSNQSPAPAQVAVHIDKGAVQIDPPDIHIDAPAIHLSAPDIHVDGPSIHLDAPAINVTTPPVTIEKGAIAVEVHAPKPTNKTVERDAEGRIKKVIEE